MNREAEKQTPRFTYFYLRLVALITMLLGATLIVSPRFIGSLFFSNIDVPVDFFVQMLGSTLIGYGSICILAIRVNTAQAAQLAVWTNLSTLLIATIISLSYSDTYIDHGWLVIGQHLLFTSGFLYCAYELSSTSPRS